MKPNFALNLSHDGIGLLHRVPGGWHQVGEVSLNDPALDETLAYLHRTASELDSRRIATMLVIPPSQILYTSLHAPGPSDEERERQVRKELAGLTPYSIKELAFDWRAKGDRVQVAAVARETLEEAENFAARHRFNPISFAAFPDADQFDGEAFFGVCSRASRFLEEGEEVEREFIADEHVRPSGFMEQDGYLPDERIAPKMDRGAPTFVSTRAGGSDSASDAVGMPELPPSRLTISSDPNADRDTVSGAAQATSDRARDSLHSAHGTHSTGAEQFSGLGARPTRTAARKRTLVTTVILALLLLAGAIVGLIAMPRAPGSPDTQTASPEENSGTGADPQIPGLSTAPPAPPSFSPITIAEEFRQATLDPVGKNHDAVALPKPDFTPEGGQPVSWPAPPVAGTTFELDGRGLVIPAVDGTPNPNGVLVFAGPPPIQPVSRPATDVASSDGTGAGSGLHLVQFHPKPRPGDLMERFERSRFAGLTRTELAQRRPAPRPPSPQSDPEVIAGLPEIALARSALPPARPGNLSDLAATALSLGGGERTPARVRTIAPRIPVSASVARQATIEHAIDLRQLTLIGVYGSSGKWHALVRLRNGRVRRVEAGDRLDGGRVAAIESGVLRYIKGGNSITLRMPDT